MDILEKIKEMQRKHKLSTYRLAKAAGLNPSTLYSTYRRNNEPKRETLESICALFGMTIEQMYSGYDVQPEIVPEQIKLMEGWCELTPGMTYKQKFTLLIFFMNNFL